MLVTNPNMIKDLYLQHYQYVLRERDILPHLKKHKFLRETLFEFRLKKATSNKSSNFTIKDLENVLKKLKTGKSEDPLGWVNDPFLLKNIGKDMKQSILKLINRIKEDLDDPDFMNLADIKSLWKNNGDRSDLNNDRGIFILNFIRMIKDKMIQNDIYEKVDESMSDSQVGSRKQKSIRNHIFVLNTIRNAAVQKEIPPIDIEIYDCAKCFDSLWFCECMKLVWMMTNFQ